jgi:excisionase family DNA binding protein
MKQIEETQGVPSARDGFVTKQQIAEHFGRTGRTIEIWMRNGILPFFKVGRSVFFRMDDVERHFERHFHCVRRPAATTRRTVAPKPGPSNFSSKQEATQAAADLGQQPNHNIS